MDKLTIPGFQIIGSSEVPASLLDGTARQVPYIAMAADLFERVSQGASEFGSAATPAYLLLVKPSAQGAKPEPIFTKLGMTLEAWLQLSEDQRTTLTEERGTLAALKFSAYEWMKLAKYQHDGLVQGRNAIVRLGMAPNDWLKLAHNQRDILIQEWDVIVALGMAPSEWLRLAQYQRDILLKSV